jgi:hypothetical protein
MHDVSGGDVEKTICPFMELVSQLRREREKMAVGLPIVKYYSVGINRQYALQIEGKIS